MTIDDNKWAHSHTWNEILSQGGVWQSVLNMLSRSATLERIISASRDRQEWLFVGCGTSFYLAEAAAGSWALLTQQPARAIPASEVLLYPKSAQPGGRKVRAVVISRSGRTSEA